MRRAILGHNWRMRLIPRRKRTFPDFGHAALSRNRHFEGYRGPERKRKDPTEDNKTVGPIRELCRHSKKNRRQSGSIGTVFMSYRIRCSAHWAVAATVQRRCPNLANAIALDAKLPPLCLRRSLRAAGNWSGPWCRLSGGRPSSTSFSRALPRCTGNENIVRHRAPTSIVCHS